MLDQGVQEVPVGENWIFYIAIFVFTHQIFLFLRSSVQMLTFQWCYRPRLFLVIPTYDKILGHCQILVSESCRNLSFNF